MTQDDQDSLYIFLRKIRNSDFSGYEMLKRGKRRISKVSGMSNTVAGSITLIFS